MVAIEDLAGFGGVGEDLVVSSVDVDDYVWHDVEVNGLVGGRGEVFYFSSWMYSDSTCMPAERLHS